VRGSFDLETVSGGNAIIAYPDGQGGTWQIDAYAALMKDADVVVMAAAVRPAAC